MKNASLQSTTLSILYVNMEYFNSHQVSNLLINYQSLDVQVP